MRRACLLKLKGTAMATTAGKKVTTVEIIATATVVMVKSNSVKGLHK
jgi:hypothetical protein